MLTDVKVIVEINGRLISVLSPSTGVIDGDSRVGRAAFESELYEALSLAVAEQSEITP